MRGIILTMMAFLAMTSLGLAAPTLDFVADDYYVADGYKSFTVQVTGVNINVLSAFTITGSRATGEDVYQVFEFNDPFYDPTPWYPAGTTPVSDQDSYITFGSLREPDLANPPATTETIVSGSSSEGMGTITNYDAGKIDSYLRKAGVDYTPVESPDPGGADDEVIDVFHLVLPDGAYATVNATFYTADYSATGYFDDITEHNLTTQVNCPLDGDANEDGKVDVGDFAILGSNWESAGTWATGDFTGDNYVDVGDFAILGGLWENTADWYVAAEAGGSPVPEPGTIVMLVLGSLCFAGYRLRK